VKVVGGVHVSRYERAAAVLLGLSDEVRRGASDG
jgi:hypothetical protein